MKLHRISVFIKYLILKGSRKNTGNKDFFVDPAILRTFNSRGEFIYFPNKLLPACVNRFWCINSSFRFPIYFRKF